MLNMPDKMRRASGFRLMFPTATFEQHLRLCCARVRSFIQSSYMRIVNMYMSCYTLSREIRTKFGLNNRIRLQTARALAALYILGGGGTIVLATMVRDDSSRARATALTALNPVRWLQHILPPIF